MKLSLNFDDFIKNLEDAIEGTPVGSLDASTTFKNLPDWSSIAALMTIAMIFSEYDATLTGEELEACITVKDLYDLTNSKIS